MNHAVLLSIHAAVGLFAVMEASLATVAAVTFLALCFSIGLTIGSRRNCRRMLSAQPRQPSWTKRPIRFP